MGLQILRRDGRLLVGHTGSVPGYAAAVWVSMVDGLGAVVLANVAAGLPVALLAADLVQIVAEREPYIPVPWQPLSTMDPQLLDLARPWYWGPAPYVLRPPADGYLELSPMSGMGRGTRMCPIGDGDRLRVHRDPEGMVSHLDLGTLVFTRQPYDPAAPVSGGVDPAGWRATDRRKG